MSTGKKKWIFAIIAAVIAIAAAAAIWLYQDKDKKISDPAQLKGLWVTKEMRQDDQLISQGATATMIAIDKKGGYRFWDNGIDHVGKLEKKDDALHFTGKDGASYLLHGQDGELIVLRQLGDEQQTWIFEREGNYRDTQMTDQEFMERYCALQKEAMDMKDQLYAGIYLGTKLGILQEMDEADAITEAEDGLVKNAAYVWYAKNDGIHITDEDVEKYMENIINEAKGADDFKDLEGAYKKAGLTFEESVRGAKDFYRIAWVKSLLYDAHEKDWEEFEADLIAKYKETKDYDALQAKLDAAAEKVKTAL